MRAYWLTLCTSLVSNIIALVMLLHPFMIFWQTRSSVLSRDV